jgi:hypothetical protein
VKERNTSLSCIFLSPMFDYLICPLPEDEMK